jgi:periplasmic divalent cation tolerance protein
MNAGDPIEVRTTVDTKESAEAIAGALLERRLAACVQIAGPVSSRYWWRGAIESADEWLVSIKSLSSLFDEIQVAIRERHPYDLPEIVAFPIVDGNAEYLAWMAAEVKPDTVE